MPMRRRVRSKRHGATDTVSRASLVASFGLDRILQPRKASISPERVHLGIDVDGVEERRVLVECPLDFFERFLAFTECVAQDCYVQGICIVGVTAMLEFVEDGAGFARAT